MKIARLLSDTDAIGWLKFEYGGYPRNKAGKIEPFAWNIAYKNGRRNIDKNNNKTIFIQLASELEAKIKAGKTAISNYTTNGASVS